MATSWIEDHFLWNVYLRSLGLSCYIQSTFTCQEVINMKKNYLDRMQMIPCEIATILRSHMRYIIIYVPADLACPIKWLFADLCSQSLFCWGQGEKLGNNCIYNLRSKIRIATEQRKKGIWMLVFPDRENAGNLPKILKTFLQGIDPPRQEKIWSF